MACENSEEWDAQDVLAELRQLTEKTRAMEENLNERIDDLKARIMWTTYCMVTRR